jgi:hypothetical protein
LCLQSFYRFQHLSHLICLCHSFIILEIDSRVSPPGRLVDSVTTAALPSLAEVEIAYLAKVLKSYPHTDQLNLDFAVMTPFLPLDGGG